MPELTDEQREQEIRKSHAYHDGSHASKIFSPTTDLLLRLLDAERARAEAAERKLQELPQWSPGRWWRAIGPQGELWCESSSEAEVREFARPTDRVQQLHHQERAEWRDA